MAIRDRRTAIEAQSYLSLSVFFLVFAESVPGYRVVQRREGEKLKEFTTRR